MSRIVAWLWDFGDGTTSTKQHPYHEYLNPGYYTVTLTVTDSYGNVRTYTAENYVNITSKAGMLFDFGLFPSRLCLVYGMQSAGGSSGWSEYSGDHWVWPESREAIVDIQLDDDTHKIAIDFTTGLPFIMNTSERSRPGDESGTAYRDKIGHPDAADGFPIGTSIVTPEMVGEDRKYRIKHDETYIDMRPVDKSKPYAYPIEISAQLLIDGNTTAREVVRGIDDSREILFTNQELGDRVQFEVNTDESGFKLTGVETTCIVSDTARYATQEFSNDLAFQQFMADPTKWFTRPDVTYDRSTGSFYTPVVDPALSDGPDGYLQSGFILTADAVFDVSSDNVVLYWYPEATVPTVLADGNPITPEGTTRDGWVFIYLDVSAYTSLTFSSGAHLFDLRFFTEGVADVTYLDLYMNDVVINSGEKFLPGYIE